MVEISESTVSVRQLISAYESITPNQYKTKRSLSVGNVLNHNVIVRTHDYNTLDDIEQALGNVKGNLTRYLVYDKGIHVDFQEKLFNLLTSVVNIVDQSNDEPNRKKLLINQIQKSVTGLNQILPSSHKIDQQIYENSDKRQFRASNLNEENNYIENGGQVSVQKLKQTFQKAQKSDTYDTTTKLYTSNTNNTLKDEVDTTSTFTSISSFKEEPITDSNSKWSVSKLRGLFEEKEKENKAGLEIILPSKSFKHAVYIPYTAESLSTYRVFKTNNGGYMNQVGILNRVQLSRAKSTPHLLLDNVKQNEEFSNNLSFGGSMQSSTDSESSDSDVGSVKEFTATGFLKGKFYFIVYIVFYLLKYCIPFRQQFTWSIS